MPSPALQKLDVLPITPLSSQPNSPSSSQPSSRRSSHSVQIQAGGTAGATPGSTAATGAGAGAGAGASAGATTPSVTTGASLARKPSSSRASKGSYFTTPNTSASLSALTTLRNLNRANASNNEKEVEQAVKEQDETVPGSKLESTSTSRRPEEDSAIASDDDEDEEEEQGGEEDEPTGILRTGHERYRRGSRRLSRMSSTLGEGITAHWTPVHSQPGSARGESPAEHTPPTSQPPPDDQSTPVPARALKDALVPVSASSAGHGPLLPPSKSAAQSPSGTPIKLSPIEQAKKSAAYRAVDMHIKPHHRVIGIGSGSTVPYVVDRILELGAEANKHRWFVPTGFQSKELIINAGLKLGDVDQFPSIDVTIDGADDVDYALNAIKGGGACHLREKVLAEAADEFIIIADYRKDSRLLGDSWKQGIPIETPPFAYSKVLANLERIPGCINPTLRMAKAKAGPVVTDNGNFVIDAPFDEAHLREPEALLMKIKMLTGVVEVGLFCRMALAAYFGNEDGSVTVRWSDGQTETFHSINDKPTITKDDIDFDKNVTDELLVLESLREAGGQEATPESLKQKLEMLKVAGIHEE